MVVIIISAGLVSISVLVSVNKKKCGTCIWRDTDACIFPPGKAPGLKRKACWKHGEGTLEKWDADENENDTKIITG